MGSIWIKKGRAVNTIIFILAHVLLWANINMWEQTFIGLLLFVAYIYGLGLLWQSILTRAFRLKRKDLITKVYAWLGSFLLLGLVAGVFSTWYTITQHITWWIFILTTLITILTYLLTLKIKGQSYKAEKIYLEKVNLKFFKRRPLMIVILFLTLIVGLYYMTQGRSAEIILSPWQSLHPYVLPLFFISTAVVLIITLSRFSIKTILFCIVAYSFFVHAYVPLSHQLPWGGDVWRHIGVESLMLEDKNLPPVLFGEEVKWRELAGIDLPEALLIPNKYIYGQFWGTATVLSRTLQIDLQIINIWLLPIVWSVALPLILFRIVGLLFGSWRLGLLGATLSNVPFALQAVGAITLPVSLGLITYLFVLMLWLQYVRDGRKSQGLVVSIFGVLLLFGYTLYAILFWFGALIWFVTRKVLQWTSRPSGVFKATRRSFMLILALVTVSFWSGIEILAKTSRWPGNIDVLNNLKQFLGQITGWFYASSIRTHDILSNNILFNHTPLSAFVESPFTVWRYHVVLVSLVVILLIAIALIFIFKKTQTRLWQMTTILFLSLIFGYIFGWFVLEGDRSFVRRFDPALAVFLILFSIYGALILIKNYQIFSFNKKIVRPLCFLLILLLSWFATTVYAGGPDLRVVSQDEYRVAEYLSEQENNTCVVADTWVLLILEGLSSRKVIGGGFPIDHQFAQNERVQIYNSFINEPNEDLLDKAKRLANSSQCFLALRANQLSEERVEIIDQIFGQESVSIEDWLVWNEKLDINLDNIE